MRLTERDEYFTINKYLKLYKAPSNQFSTLKQYFTFIYPDKAEQIKQIRNINSIDLLEKIGEQYINECKAGQNWGIDLLNYKNSDIIGRGGSVNSKLCRVRVWLEWNDLTLSPRYEKSLYNSSTNRNSINYAPTRDEIKHICDHLELPYKTLTLLLVSSGARCGSEAMKACAFMRLTIN